jgi:membrane fusion protein, multidrug efflux system
LRQRNVVVLVLAAAAIAVAVLLVRAHSRREAAAAAAAKNSVATPVITALVVQQDVASYFTGIGTVQPMQSVTVTARVDGQLDKVDFTEGQDVHKGDLLAQIDPRSFQTLLEQATAQKAHDVASLAAANRDLERYTLLVKDGSISRQAFDAQTATVDQLKATLQSDQAAIDNATVQLSYTTIRAPIDGRTGLRLVDVGNQVHAASTTGLVVINQIDPIAVVFTLPEDNFQAVNKAIQAAAKTPLQVLALGREDNANLGAGKLLLVNNEIDTGTGTFQLKAVFTNGAHALWPGQYVNARVLLGTLHDALTIPEPAVQRGPKGLFVYVVAADGAVAAQPVHMLQSQEGKAVIDQGLKANDRVVVDGQFKIRQGSKVTEIQRGTAPGGSAPSAPAGKGS